jgi:hypothetical protein
MREREREREKQKERIRETEKKERYQGFLHRRGEEGVCFSQTS